ncbi:MAG: DUF1549 domain-containing protein, partial [Planctomycetia bacterium]
MSGATPFLLLAAAVVSAGDRPTPSLAELETRRAFDATVAVVLAKHCLECHSPGLKEGELDLSTWAGAKSVVTPGSVADSLLWSHVDNGEMPKDRPAPSAAEKETLRRWIAAGAVWGTEPIDPYTVGSDRRAGYDWWSLQPLRVVPPPVVRDAGWPRESLDRFILAKLEAEGLAPAGAVDRRTLARRISFALVGLPPDPAEVERFVADRAPGAEERFVDAKLASPHFGERWARHWLDVVRFGESQGFERNRVRAEAWRYRDWVAAAFNADLPYQRFVTLQLAGDVVAPGDLAALVATGYHVCGTWDQVGHNEGSPAMRRVAREEHVEDLVGTLGQTFLGLTLHCARCHDHKFDPIAQREYYQFAALLGGVRQAEKERADVKPAGDIPMAPWAEAFKGAVHAVDPKPPGVTYVLARGNPNQPGAEASPAGLKAIGGLSSDFGLDGAASDADRRRRLAEWIVDPKNPLPARVFVNRVWHYLFETGLVD